MTLRAPAAGVCLAAAVLAVLCLLPGAALGAQTRLSIKIVDTEVDLGERTVIRGRLFTTGEEASQRVRLVARKFPYKRERVVAGTFTGTGGTYFFRVRPSLNTRYRVTYEDVRSDQVRVFVFPVDSETSVETIEGTNTAHAHFWAQFPRDYPLRLSDRRITWYFRKDTSEVYRQIAASRSRATPSKRMIGDVRFDLPDSREPYDYFVTWCYALGREGQDIGIGRNAGGGCPRRFRIDG